MFHELLNHGIWPDILAYKRLENTRTLRLRSPIAITKHNNENVLFNKMNHFRRLRFLAQKQNSGTHPPKVLKTTTYFIVLNLDQRELL